MVGNVVYDELKLQQQNKQRRDVRELIEDCNEKVELEYLEFEVIEEVNIIVD